MNGLFRLRTDDRPDCASPGESEQAPSDLCIGILNHLFFWPELYRRTGGMSIVFLFDENPDVASAGSGGAAVGGARSVPDHAARSNSERAAPSARVGNRFSAPQIVWNRSNRCAGERGGARGERASPSCGAWARFGCSVLGCTRHGGFREGIRRAAQRAPGCTVSRLPSMYGRNSPRRPDRAALNFPSPCT